MLGGKILNFQHAAGLRPRPQEDSVKDHLAAAKASVEKAEDEGVLDRLHECCMNDGDGGTHPMN